MIRLFQIAVFSCAAILLTGCNGAEKAEPIWEHTKIGDLAPSYSDKQPGEQSLKTVNLDAYVFEIPAKNISALDEIWRMLYTKPLRLNDPDAFGANSFSVGFGQIQIWNEISVLLRAADGKKVETAMLLLLPDGRSNDLAVEALYDERTIFYTPTTGSMEGVTIGPGELALRIKAEKIPGSRGVCRVSALPIFLPLIRSSIPQLAGREKSGELPFTCCGFDLKMSPGDFFFLGPVKYIDNQITLGSVFFSRPQGSAFFNRPRNEPIVRIFLLVCTNIID